MDAVEFYKSMKRMCYSGEMCEKCPRHPLDAAPQTPGGEHRCLKKLLFLL